MIDITGSRTEARSAARFDRMVLGHIRVMYHRYLFAPNNQLWHASCAFGKFSIYRFHIDCRHCDSQPLQTTHAFVRVVVVRWHCRRRTEMRFLSLPHVHHIRQHDVPVFVVRLHDAARMTVYRRLVSQQNLQLKIKHTRRRDAFIICVHAKRERNHVYYTFTRRRSARHRSIQLSGPSFSAFAFHVRNKFRE